MKAHTPSRNTALICLILFILGLIGMFVPLAHVQYIGPYIKFINHIAAYLLIAGYGLVAFRDPYGIRPLAIGEGEGPYGREVMLASETVAIEGTDWVRHFDVDPFVKHCLLEGLDDVLELDLGTASITAIRRDYHFALAIDHAVADRVGRKSAKDHGVRRADSGTCEHRNGESRNKRHIERDPIARLHADAV